MVFEKIFNFDGPDGSLDVGAVGGVVKFTEFR
jgi:hypothetical protein